MNGVNNAHVTGMSVVPPSNELTTVYDIRANGALGLENGEARA